MRALEKFRLANQTIIGDSIAWWWVVVVVVGREYPEQTAEEGLVLLGKRGVTQLVRQEDARGQNDGLDGLAEPPLQRLLAGQVRSQLQG